MPRPPKAKESGSTTPHRDPIAQSSSSLIRDPDARLPVNPRRTKVAPEQRKRVAKACNRCNQKRIKCSGDQPCKQCVTGGRECRYPPPAQKITITKQDLDRYNAQTNRIRLLERLLEDRGVSLPVHEPVQTTPPPDAGDAGYDEGSMQHSGFSPPDDVNMVDAMDGITEFSEVQEDRGKLLTDTDGTERFLGETSGANYLDGCKEFIDISHTIVCGNIHTRGSSFLASRGRYQTFDSRPMGLLTVDPLWLPPQDEIATMLAEISVYFQDGNGKFGTGGIFYWPWKDVASINPSPSSPPASKKGNRHLALYHVGFALSSLVKGQPSEHFFSRAWSLLGTHLGITLYNLDDVPALGLMALYLIENNRRDVASVCINNAIHVCVMHGAHKPNHSDTSPAEEMRRRTFWTIYILDRWLSCLLGRPASFSNEAFAALPLPEEVPGLPSPAGLSANVQLADISQMMVMHSSSSRTSADKIDFAKEMIRRLRTWNERLPNDITLVLSKILEPVRQQLPASHPHPALALILADQAPPESEPQKDLHSAMDLRKDLGARGSDRAYLSLHMSYNQLIILAIRPAFLAAVKKLLAERYLSGKNVSIESHRLYQEFRQGGNAARQNLIIGEHIKTYLEAPGNKLLVADLHHIFNAALILLLFRISFVNLRSGDTEHINFAMKVFKQEAESGNEYGKDCSAMLEEMNLIVDGLHQGIHWLRWTLPTMQKDGVNWEFEQRLEQLMPWQWDEEEEGDVWETLMDNHMVRYARIQDSEADIEMDSPYQAEA